MGWKENLKKAREEKARQRKESRAFAGVIKKRTLQARRQAYEKEVLQQATLQGRRMAQPKQKRQFFRTVGKMIVQSSKPKPRRRTVAKPRVQRQPVSQSSDYEKYYKDIFS